MLMDILVLAPMFFVLLQIAHHKKVVLQSIEFNREDLPNPSEYYFFIAFLMLNAIGLLLLLSFVDMSVVRWPANICWVMIETDVFLILFSLSKYLNWTIVLDEQDFKIYLNYNQCLSFNAADIVLVECKKSKHKFKKDQLIIHTKYVNLSRFKINARQIGYNELFTFVCKYVDEKTMIGFDRVNKGV